MSSRIPKLPNRLFKKKYQSTVESQPFLCMRRWYFVYPYYNKEDMLSEFLTFVKEYLTLEGQTEPTKATQRKKQ